jgi:hypothetical protein
MIVKTELDCAWKASNKWSVINAISKNETNNINHHRHHNHHHHRWYLLVSSPCVLHKALHRPLHVEGGPCCWDIVASKNHWRRQDWFVPGVSKRELGWQNHDTESPSAATNPSQWGALVIYNLYNWIQYDYDSMSLKSFGIVSARYLPICNCRSFWASSTMSFSVESLPILDPIIGIR